MSFSEVAIDIKGVGKVYQVYETPRDRLKQLVVSSCIGLLAAVLKFVGIVFEQKVPIYYREFKALNAISFQVKKGETVGVIGLNGSGKSTLLQLICGTVTPSEGNVEVKGRISALLELGSGFNPDYSGRENVFLNGQILGLTSDEIKTRYEAIVAFADIGDFIDQPVKTYSSGMVVRLAFSVAVHVEPEILIVDEALAVGDMPFQIKCFAHLRRLRDRGTSILFVSHDLSTVRSFCDRAVYLDRGNCLAIGLSNDVCQKYEYDCLKTKYLKQSDTTSNESTVGKSVTYSNREVPSNVFELLKASRQAFQQKKHEGSQSITIEAFLIVDENGRSVETIDPKQEVTAFALLKAKSPLTQNFHFGIQVHDRQGMPLMTVRDSTFDKLIALESNEPFLLSLRFSLPLKAGPYYCQAGVIILPAGEIFEEWHHKFDKAEVADIVEFAAIFSVLPYRRHYITVPVLNESELNVFNVKGIFK